jgi:hypothetical protein
VRRREVRRREVRKREVRRREVTLKALPLPNSPNLALIALTHKKKKLKY